MQSSKFDDIIQRVRRAEMSLFIGSGFSMKAGGPSATSLVRSLARRFPKGYKKGLASQPLDDICKEYVKYCLGSREELMDFLKEKMAFKRTDLSDHRALAMIPHLRHMFTTNYDTLLEDSFAKDDVRVVRCSGDCSKEERPVNIYKVHGDLTCPDEIVITRDDYDALISSDRNMLVWNKVEDAFASSDVLFLGYSLDDTNVQLILRRVGKVLGGKRRRVFLIAPGLTEGKIHELETLKVEYIDAYAEEFLTALTEKLKNTVYRDLKDGILPIDIANRFFSLYHIKTVVEFVDGKTSVKNFSPADESVPHTINFTTKACPDGLKNPVDFDFVEHGDRSEAMKVPALVYQKDNIVDFECRINGVKVMGLEDLSRLELGPSTIQNGMVDVAAQDVDFLENVPYTLYKSQDKLVLSIDTPLCILDFSWLARNASVQECVVKTTYKADYGSYEKAVAWTHFFMALFSGKEVSLGSMLQGRLNAEKYAGMLKQFERSLEYYNSIRKIEVFRKQTFSEHNRYEEGLEEAAAIVYHMLVGDTIEEKLNVNGRIECHLSPGTEPPVQCSGGDAPVEFSALRMATTTDNDVVLNGESFGRITKWKDLLKCHIEKVYEMDNERFVSFAPDIDHWMVRYVKDEEGN